MSYTNSILFKVQIITQIAIILIFYAFDFGANLQAVICGILLCLIGIPHGANDHLYRKDKTAIGMLKFLGIYLGIISLYVILWYLMPILALILFFLVSFHHFGQSNFENNKVWYSPSIIWGIILIVFPVIIHFEEAILIFKSMVGLGDFNQLIFNYNFTWPNIWQSISLILITVIYLFSLLRFQKKHFVSYFFQFLLLIIWYFITPLLFGFIVVFCLWHSMQSIDHQLTFYTSNFKKKKENFFIACIPFSLISLLGFIAYLYFFSFNVGTSFILLSLITLPHVLIMHKLYVSE
jgi:Brp/Blh family beta-carotene 15,15'-monooxygenase